MQKLICAILTQERKTTLRNNIGQEIEVSLTHIKLPQKSYKEKEKFAEKEAKNILELLNS